MGGNKTIWEHKLSKRASLVSFFPNATRCKRALFKFSIADFMRCESTWTVLEPPGSRKREIHPGKNLVLRNLWALWGKDVWLCSSLWPQKLRRSQEVGLHLKLEETRKTRDRPEANRGGNFSVSHSLIRGLQYLVSKTLSKWTSTNRMWY